MVEVRKDGTPLEETPLGLPPVIVRPKSAGRQSRLAVADSAALRDRLPLHLKFRFEEPGAYEVRYSLIRWQAVKGEGVLRSEWTEISILPSNPEISAVWLEGMQHQDPSSAGELLCSFLPSLLAQKTPETFAILSRYFSYRGGLVQLYTRNVASLYRGIVPQDQMPPPVGRITF